MEDSFKKDRYIFAKGCSISHTYGKSAGCSTLSFSHYTSDCMFIYFIKGYGNIKIEGKSYEIKEGDVALINQSELYFCEIYPTAFHERVVLRINCSFLDNFSLDASKLVAPFFKREKGKSNFIDAFSIENSKIKLTFDEILNYASTESPSQNLIALCKTVELLYSLCDRIAFFDKIKRARCENSLINDCLLYINEHFCEEISVSHLAKVFNVSDSYLAHLFKKFVGISPWEYIISKRISYFNTLIRSSHEIKEAYLSVGFQNYSNFFRLYKKYMNMTPSEFKRCSSP